MNIYHTELNLRFQNDQLKFKYSFNENTKFSDLLEYVAFLYPNYNFCRCFAFYNNVNQINNEIKIKDYNLNGFLNIGNLNKDNKCYCKYKGLFTMSKFEIINKINNNANNNDYYSTGQPLGGANELGNINQVEDLKSLKKKIIDLQNINQQLKLKLEKSKNQVIEFKKIIGNNTIHINENNNINERNIANIKAFKKEIFEDFYDVIIDIKSVKDINKGWKIKMNERGLKNYGDHKTNNVIKIGVIGNSNKGKSFILSKISKISLPSGTSIRTEGLSVKYPELEGYKDRKIVLLDSAGLETPVLNIESTEPGNKEKEMFKEKSREKLITELFLQNYIINTSDILIVVVGILTYSEQKLLNRIRTEIQRAKLKKTLYVIHNLITYTSINQVQEYIEDYVLKSATFHLEKGHKISTSEEQISGDYYYEKNSDPKIYHLIYANEGSEAGNYYNNYTLKIIENSYIDVTDLKNFDIIESIKNRFIEVSKEIIENNDKQLEIGDFCDNDNDNYNCIKLKDEKEITLKKCLIDELGFSNLKGNGFEPTYNFYQNKTDNKIIVRVEAPGNSEIKSKIEYRGENTIIQLSGRKKQDKEPEKLEDNLFNSREFGDFSVDIPLKTEDYKVLNEEPAKKFVSGLFIIEYKLESNCQDGKMFKPEELV
jgi:HSP20 family molecular chaperone IbpA